MVRNGGRSLAAIAFALIPFGLPAASAVDPAKDCPVLSTEAAADLFQRWDASLATGDAEQVANLYAHDAVLLPALSDVPLVRQDQIHMHFAQFLLRHPRASVVRRTIVVDCTTATDAGTYVYRVTGRRKGTRMLIGGSYALRYEFRDGDWRIVRHHVSGAYRPLSSAEDLAAARSVSRRASAEIAPAIQRRGSTAAKSTSALKTR